MNLTKVQEAIQRDVTAWIASASFGKKSREDAASAPLKGGVYVFRHIQSRSHIYVGESANLRSRLLQRYVKKTESTLTRAIRRHLSLTDAPIETIRKRLFRDYEFDYYPVQFGRREIEEFLGKKLKIKQPNKAPEPTRTAVTPRAAARVAPAVRVAHL